MSTLWFTTLSKLFKKADCAVSAVAVLPTIPDLAEAWEFRIKYAYALTLSDILSKPTSVKPSDFLGSTGSLNLGQYNHQAN